MPSYQTNGLVIGRTNFGEADRIIRLITAEHGKLSAVAKGVRKIKSRLGGHLELFANAQLTLTTGRNLDLITSARLSWYPHQLTADYNRLELAYLFAGLIDRTAQEHTPQSELFAHFAEALRATDDGAVGPLIELWYKLRLLELTGYRPELNVCLVCGQNSDTAAYAFDAPRGGLVCAIDASVASQPMGQPAIKLWRFLCDYSYATVSRISNGPTLAAATLPLCDEFYEHHLGRAMRLAPAPPSPAPAN